MNQRMYEYWREKIVKYLKKKRKPILFQNLVKDFGIPYSTVSRWITILEIKGIIKTWSDENRRKYVELVRE